MVTSDVRRVAELAFILLLIVGIADEHTRRLERAAERQILAQLGSTGTMHVQIEPRWGALGVLLARAKSIRVEAEGFRTAQMPFFTEPPVHAWQGKVGQVHILFRDFSVAGVPIRRFEANLPDVTLDSRAAAFHLRVRLFHAGWGAGWVELDEEGLLAFVRRRLPEVQSPVVRITPTEVQIEGELSALLVPWRFWASGRVQVSADGLRLLLTDVQLQLEGKSLPAGVTQKVISALNPVLDVARDLGLGSAFRIEKAELRPGFIRLIGRATVPPRETGGVNGDRKR